MLRKRLGEQEFIFASVQRQHSHFVPTSDRYVLLIPELTSKRAFLKQSFDDSKVQCWAREDAVSLSQDEEQAFHDNRQLTVSHQKCMQGLAAVSLNGKLPDPVASNSMRCASCCESSFNHITMFASG